ncbi:MAG TPA: dienelactone hydrolase family protein [Candidatus Polarisedimenticolia bacterium]|jgi:carboxymethylenebutenolidase|nr:dienelactone hydrolase family protein [Candidatus Polarisedimenticolia bacterium]
MLSLKRALALAFILASARVSTAVAAGETITYEVGGESVRAYLAKPAVLDGRPGIVVVHHFWGLDAHTKGVADRFAGLGYLTVAPDLYRGRLGGDYGLAKDLMDRLDGSRAVAIVKGAIGYLRSLDGGAARRPIALVGFDMGGRVALSAALQAADVQALVIFYGHVETTPESVMPIQVPVLGVFGTDDMVVRVEEARKFEASLKAAGKQATIIIYQGMAHAFFDESRADYDQSLGNDAWIRTQDFLKTALGPVQAPPPAAVPPAGAPSAPSPPGQ